MDVVGEDPGHAALRCGRRAVARPDATPEAGERSARPSQSLMERLRRRPFQPPGRGIRLPASLRPADGRKAPTGRPEWDDAAMDLGLKDKKALVVGASRGLGAAIARTLALEGATVFAAARSVDKIEAWIAELPADARGRVSALRLDTGDLAQVDAACETLLAQGGVDILVNNTGGPPPGVAAEVKRDAWITQFQGMAANLFHLTQRLLPPMRERKWGRVITVASSGIEQPIPNLALSNGIRSAVLGWSKTLAAEVAADGVTVNMVLPGRIETERLGQLDKANAERQNVAGREDRRSLARRHPGRPLRHAAGIRQCGGVPGGRARLLCHGLEDPHRRRRDPQRLSGRRRGSGPADLLDRPCRSPHLPSLRAGPDPRVQRPVRALASRTGPGGFRESLSALRIAPP